MMKWRYYDHWPENDPLPGLVELAGLFGANPLSELPDTNRDWEALIFVHAGEQQGLIRQDWKGIADAGRKRYVVLVSSQPDSFGPGDTDTDQGYFALRRPVTDLLQDLQENNERLRSFRGSCENGKPNWALLESAQFPEHLVAAYLTCQCHIWRSP